jgi:hypothetical protein
MPSEVRRAIPRELVKACLLSDQRKLIGTTRRREPDFSPISPRGAPRQWCVMEIPYFGLALKNGEDSFFNLSSGMPGPRSDTDSSAIFRRGPSECYDAIFGRRFTHRIDPVHHKVQDDLRI